MKASEAKLLEFLKKSPQFVIPIYQRAYSWTEKECLQLWNDIKRAGRNDEVSAHFIGSVVYVQKGLYSVSSHTPLLVIDGQQRLTTLSLLIEALAEVLDKQQTEPIDGFSARKLRNYYLLNPEEDGERKFKLILSQTDKSSWISILQKGPRQENSSLKIYENFQRFQDLLEKEKDDLSTICKGIAKVMVVDIALDRGQDNPQLIFESMNSTGRELSQADLIRNFILMGLDHELQTKLFTNYWRPMELGFGQKAYSTHFDSFMRHFLTVKTGEIPRMGDIYTAFKKYVQKPEIVKRGIENLVSDLRAYSNYFCSMALGAESDKHLKQSFHDLRELKVDVAYPLLLEMYHDYASKNLNKEDFCKCINLIESYVFRRAVCAIPTNSMNKTFANLGKSLKKDRYLESVQAAFLLLPSYRRFPKDEEFDRGLKVRDLYNFRSRSFWLRKLENYGRREPVAVDQYTIEHIMPQSDGKAEKVPDYWRSELGLDWERVWESKLHTLGNLTLTGYNSEYSNKSFTDKSNMTGGFKESPLRLNESVRCESKWDDTAINKRADTLAKKATTVWGAPSLDASILDEYKPGIEQRNNTYSVDDHPYLKTSLIKPLFDALQKEILALDSVVSEEILKFYVAYKAETNFVDVVPQAKRLCLSLNMSFHEIEDPRGLCKDITGLGRWGNGDVEVGLSTLEELPYVMGLIRQSFETQIGDGGV
ncbi:MAG: DUF262 domain-containing protein [SAR324 cluster bacterium]|nr:DUF262 domain-containing protein [SAR324 cluster bacterium]